jgi:hypothetical protein
MVWVGEAFRATRATFDHPSSELELGIDYRPNYTTASQTSQLVNHHEKIQESRAG